MPRRSSKSNTNRSHNDSRRSDEPVMSHWLDTAKDAPLATAAVAAGAVAAGVFLWSKRNQISNQLSDLSGQISDWTSQMQGGNGRDLALTGGPNESSAIEASRATGRSRSSGAPSRSTGSPSSSPRSGSQANQTTGGRSQGDNTTF